MNVGAELKRAREARGLSLPELASATKISASRLAAIENNALAALPPINYVRGFVRVYATEVGLDPDDLGDRYIAQFEPEGPAAIEPATGAPPAREPHHVPAPAAEQGQQVQPVPVAPIAMEPQEKARPYAALSLVVLLVLAGYLFLRTPDGAALADRERTAPEASIVPAETPLPRTAVDLSTPPIVTPPLDPASAPVAQIEPVIVSEIDPKPVPNPASLPPPTAGPDAAAAANVSGSWTFTTEVQSASDEQFRGLQLEYRLVLSQQSGRVTGTGQRITERGEAVAPAGRTSISVEGTVAGTHIELRFTERAAPRVIRGSFILDPAPNGELRGTFTSDASQSHGTVRAQRVQ
jgi:transcriptional regulator with XRE-family HTH domain